MILAAAPPKRIGSPDVASESSMALCFLRTLDSLSPSFSPHGAESWCFRSCFPGCFLYLSSRHRPRELPKLGAPGALLPVTGAEYHALVIHPLHIPGFAKGTGM